ncbi:unnamed protein product, partial [Amoebophrya sp. A25]
AQHVGVVGRLRLPSRLIVSRLQILHELASRHGAESTLGDFKSSDGPWASIATTSSLAGIDNFSTVGEVSRVRVANSG